MPNKYHETSRDLFAEAIQHLVINTPQEKNRFAQLQALLVRAAVPEERQDLKSERFTFENADLFSPELVSEDNAALIRQMTERQADAESPAYKVFVREVPVSSTQIHASRPLWAAGAAVEHSVGPFTNADGRLYWFDFFRIEKLVALYVQGNPQPALLFKVRTGFQFMDARLPLAADLTTAYRLNAGSIWINSQLLAQNAPVGHFTGLTIKSGTISLNAKPKLVNGKLTIAPNTLSNVELQLQQQAVTGADPSSPYGKDARKAKLELPQTVSFHFSNRNKAIDSAGDASWVVYGHKSSFKWNPQEANTYDDLLHRVLIPFIASKKEFQVSDNQSLFHTFVGKTAIKGSYWALPAAPIDVANPSPAEGIGAMLVRGAEGLSSAWSGLQGGAVNLKEPYIMAAPGRIAISDLAAGNAFCQQNFKLWKDEKNAFVTEAHLQYPSVMPFFFNTLAEGVESLMSLANADVQIDRPVTVTGQPLAIRSQSSLLILAATNEFRLIYLFDDNILFDNLLIENSKTALPKPISLALHNALFKTTEVNGCLLFGRLADDFVKVEQGFLFLTMGLYAYLPTLPDPYAANVNRLKYQFRGASDEVYTRARYSAQPTIWMWLVCQLQWQTVTENDDKVTVSFHFAPLQGQVATIDTSATNNQYFNFLAGVTEINELEGKAYDVVEGEDQNDLPLEDYGARWDRYTQHLQNDYFALLDVSTNADLMGVSFGSFGDGRMAMVTTHVPATDAHSAAMGFPLQIKGMDVVSQGVNVKAFTVPQISWEPVFNLTPPDIKGDPPEFFNYYPDDGGATRMLNNSGEQVALAPIPLTDFLVENFATQKGFAALSLFTLPFGMRALAYLQKNYFYEGGARRGANLHFNSKKFDGEIEGARQLEIDGGQALREGESDMFMGSTLQTNNILDFEGNETGDSTLGASITKIFNNEWMLDPFQLIRQRGVPLERMDWSGYGANMFSNWLNPKAAIAETSQAKFDVWMGRCAHEIIQVVSIIEPWKIKVVRTITLFRVGSGYVYRHDSGWRAESDGRFHAKYYLYIPSGSGTLIAEEQVSNYEVHPGIVKGLFQVKNIRETEEVAPFKGTMTIKNGELYAGPNGEKETAVGNVFRDYELQPVFFDAEVEIENPVSGFVTKEINGKEKKLVPSKRILGFVQIAPRGMLITADTFHEMIARQAGSIGGTIDCLVDIGQSGQQMRLNRFDISNSYPTSGNGRVFAVAGSGSVLLPKDGSWSMVKHLHGTGEVSPVPQDLSVPLIRAGKIVDVKQDGELKLDNNPADILLRIANPTELLRDAVNDTLNYGFLQSTDTQKALFLTPSFKHGTDMLLSKTPPLFADAFRIVSSKSIFPNIGNAVNNFGDAINLGKKGTEFAKNALKDGGKDVLEVMKINETIAGVKKEGYKLLKNKLIEAFDLPNSEWVLIELGGAFKIYLEYKADNIKKPKNPDGSDGGTKNAPGALDFDVNSFADELAEQWKSKMSNVGVVVDLGSIKRLMTIKGNWDAKKGSEAQYAGNKGDPDFPSPQIEFASELEPVIEILQILQDLQGENYKDAFQKGLKLAMSNKAGGWEYKMEASKEIPVVRFPMPMFMYNDPNAPLKLEAGLKMGMYFNAALKVPTDPSQLLPTAGVFLGFYGRLSVMCVSLSVATVYAIGQVNLDIAADTKIGPSLKMKFGFGAQIVVGLPVVGNVSVLYMVGVEIYTDATSVIVSAFLLFQGHAELLGGLVSVTITIEAKGTIARIGDRTDMAAQVTFGIDISIFLVINISFSTSWQEQRQIA